MMLSKKGFHNGNKYFQKQIQKEGKKIDIEIKKESYFDRIVYAIIIFLTFVYYGNTIFNEYALDDTLVITQNDFTKKGIKGIPDILTNEFFTGFFKVRKQLVSGGRYRPFSQITFAIEYELFGFNPHISHFINVLLFAILCIFIYKTLKVLLINFIPHYEEKEISLKRFFNIPFLATIIFLAHPIHTEAVANIKGRDEIFSMLGGILAFYYTLLYVFNKKNKYLIYLFLFFTIGIFSKEIAITFLATIPLGIWFFHKGKLKEIYIPILVIVFSSLFYFLVRYIVLSAPSIKTNPELMNDSFLEMNTSQKFATITYTMGLYIKLLFFPHPLTYDYYPYHIPITEWKHFRALASLLLIVVIAFFTLRNLSKKKIWVYGVLFYAISLSPVSNIFFPIGTFMSERFAFTPSLGFCLIAANFFTFLEKKLKKNFFVYALLCIVLMLYGIKTITRNSVWKNDFTLFTTDVKVSVNGAKSNCSAGGKLLEEAQKLTEPKDSLKRKEYLNLSLKYLNHALKIHPRYVDALLLLGNAYYEYNKNYDSTINAYLKILKINPNHDLVYKNLEIIFRTFNDVNYKIKVYDSIFKINPNRFEVNYQLGRLYGKEMNNLKISKFFFNRAYKINPIDKNLLKDLGVVYGLLKQYDSSLFFLLKAVELDTSDAQTYMNIAVTYMFLKDTLNAIKYYDIAKSKNSNLISQFYEDLKKSYLKRRI